MSDQAQNSDLGGSRVIEIEGKRFAAGLLWWPLESEATQKKEIAEFAQEEGMNLVTVHSSAMNLMAGFAKAEPAQLKLFDGAWSLASVLATKLGDSWIGVFDLEDGNCVLVAVSDGAVVPGCDLVGEVSSIREQLLEMSHARQWSEVYISNEELASYFDGVKVKSIELKDVLSDRKYDRAYRLRPIKQTVDPKIMLAAIGLVLVGGALYGWNWYQGKKEAQFLEQAQRDAEMQQLMQLDEDRKEALNHVAKLQIKPDWLSEPPAHQIMGRCVEGILQLPLSVAGWTLSNAKCDSKEVVGTYQQFLGSSAFDFSYAAQEHVASGRISAVGDSKGDGQLILDLNTVYPVSPRLKEELIDDKQWQAHWLAHFQWLGMQSTVTERPHQKQEEPAQSIIDLIGLEKATPEPPWWTKYEWSYQSEGIRADRPLKGIAGQGLTVKQVQLNIQGDTWAWGAQGEVNVR